MGCLHHSLELQCHSSLLYLLFFFRKINNGSVELRKNVLMSFLRRNMILYGFWFITLLPITLSVRNWFSEGIMKFLQFFFFNSTFRASWDLMELNIGMCITLYFSLKLSVRMQMILTFPIYLLCCLFTNWYGVVEESALIIRGYHAYISIFRSLANSFPVALFWLAVGRWFAY